MMNRETNWYDYDDGYSLGTSGSDGGLILRDEENAGGGRLTLEEGSSAPFSITCTIYGAMSHTRFFPAEDAANEEFESMKIDLDEILQVVSADDDSEDERLDAISDEISDFFERFP